MVTVTFAYNGTTGGDGTPQDWAVPSGVTQVHVVAYGAGTSGGTNAGLGGRISADISVTPGKTLRVRVGGSSGFNGGGVPGSFSSSSPGGGASDVRRGTDTLAHRVIVAGGAGGQGFIIDDVAPFRYADGGNGGSLKGQDGHTSNPGPDPGPPGGIGGTQTAGGAGGAGGGGSPPGGNGEPGSLAQGGQGSVYGGGGGGGGYYGGGGGGVINAGSLTFHVGGGAGGSSFASPTATNVSYQRGARRGSGLVTITYQTFVARAP
jgi:hypothetical protein